MIGIEYEPLTQKEVSSLLERVVNGVELFFTYRVFKLRLIKLFGLISDDSKKRVVEIHLVKHGTHV